MNLSRLLVELFACWLLTMINTRQTNQIDHDQDHPDPNLPFWGAVQDLYSTDPTQGTCPRACRLYGSHPTTGARSHRSYRSYRSYRLYRSYRSGEYLPCLADTDRELYYCSGNRWSVLVCRYCYIFRPTVFSSHIDPSWPVGTKKTRKEGSYFKVCFPVFLDRGPMLFGSRPFFVG